MSDRHSDSSVPATDNVVFGGEKAHHATKGSVVPGSNADLAAEIAAMSPEEYAAYEKKLLWKIDRNLIPWMTLLYMMSFLDRVNIGTARITGLTTQLHLTSLQYSNASMIFFVPYVFFEVPSNLVLKKLRPSRWLPFTMVCWSIFQIFMGLVTNYGQLLALRFCLGLFESGLFPGLNFYLTAWYRREELNKRVAIFFAGAVLSGAFGGILGYGFSRMNGVGGYQGWSWIFIMEGILTFIVSLISFWMIYDFPDTAKFLTPLEREFVALRMRKQQGNGLEAKFSWAGVRVALSDWKTYVMMLMYIGAAEPLYSVSLFAPSIIASLGKWTTAQSLLLSVPPWALCFITTIGTAWLSDRYRRRAYPLMFWSIIAIIGYATLIGTKVPKVDTNPGRSGGLYFAVFLVAAGVGPLIACTIAWTGNTWGSNYWKKAICMGLVFSAGNSGGIVSSEAYQGKDAPGYRPGHATALAFCALNLITATGMHIYFRRENARRDRLYGPIPEQGSIEDWNSPEQLRKWGLEHMTREQIVALGDEHPAHRYMT